MFRTFSFSPKYHSCLLYIFPFNTLLGSCHPSFFPSIFECHHTTPSVLSPRFVLCSFQGPLCVFRRRSSKKNVLCVFSVLVMCPPQCCFFTQINKFVVCFLIIFFCFSSYYSSCVAFSNSSILPIRLSVLFAQFHLFGSFDLERYISI